MARKVRFNFKGFSTRKDIRDFERTNPIMPLENSTYEALKETANGNKSEIGLSFFMLGGDYKKPFSYNYEQILSEVNALVNMLHSQGVDRNEVIGLVLPNLPETCFALIAAESVGIVFPMNPLLEPAQLKELMIAAKVKVLITLSPFIRTDIWEKIDSIRYEVSTLHTIYQVDMNNYLRGIKKLVVGLINSFKKAGKSDKRQKVLNYSTEIKKYNRNELDFDLNIKLSDAAAYFHTGGTTGRPKIAVQTHENICFNAWSTGAFFDTSEESNTIYGGLPLFHVFGAMTTLSLIWAGSGHLVLVTPKGYRGDGVLKNFWKIVAHYKINFLAAVPAIYKMLDDIDVGNSDVSCVRFAVSGAAALPVEVMRSFEQKTGVKMIEGYGSTEATCISSVNPPYGVTKIESVGLPIPFLDVKIFHLSDSLVVEVDTNEIGIVGLNGPNVIQGYLEEAHNVDIWIEFEGKKYFNTGDLGKLDDDGYLYLTGRKKELIIRGGHNIDPKTIEEPLYSHPSVAFAAAVSRPDARVGEVPVVYVELKKDKIVSKEELMTFLTPRISERAAIPKEILIIDKMPFTTIEKIYKPELYMREIKDVYTNAIKPSFPKATILVKETKEDGIVAYISGCSEKDKVELDKLLGVYSYRFIVSATGRN